MGSGAGAECVSLAALFVQAMGSSGLCHLRATALKNVPAERCVPAMLFDRL